VSRLTKHYQKLMSLASWVVWVVPKKLLVGFALHCTIV